MILFPAIDLKSGLCVRLYKGRFEEQTVYSHNPAAVSSRWAQSGAEWIHVIDLDGSLGDNQANRKAIESIRAVTEVKLQLGGGIRSLETARRWFDLGVERLILGTIACEDPDETARIAASYPGRIAVALDAVGEEVRVRGWRETGGRNLFDVAGQLKNLGIAVVIYTDVERDGTQAGPNLDNTREVAAISGIPTIASGGVASLDDLKAIKTLEKDGVIGVISGKALYENTLDFVEGAALLKS